MPFAKPGNLLPRLQGGKEKYTDTNEFLSPGVLIAYKKRTTEYPSKPVKYAVNAAAIQARNIVRIANDRLAEVCLQRKKEPDYFTETMARHFNLKEGDLAGGLLKNNVKDKPFSLREVMTHDRRWALDRIRRDMLSLSFHLNTGMYLIDQDVANRDVITGHKLNAMTELGTSNEAYVGTYASGKTFHFCGFRNGEIHAEFSMFPSYSLNSGARIIIHEACHKYLNVGDTYYAWDANYAPSLHTCLHDNADSFAWTAVSLATKGLKMATDGSDDWTNCPGAKL